MMEATLERRLAAEGVGTALLVLFGAGSVVAALRLGDGELDYSGLGMVAIAFALTIAIAIYAFGATSGAHINPAQERGEGLGDDPLRIRDVVGQARSSRQSWRWRSIGERRPAGRVSMIGLSVAAAILASGPLTGGSLNPARTFGPMLVTGIGGGDASWGDLPAYVIGPVLGGLLAAFTYEFIARPRALEEVAPAPLGDGEGRAETGVQPRAASAPGGNGGDAAEQVPSERRSEHG